MQQIFLGQMKTATSFQKAARKVPQGCLMDKTTFESNSSMTEGTGFEGTIAVGILYIKYKK